MFYRRPKRGVFLIRPFFESVTRRQKIGNAVCRNRAKRRLRALCAALLPLEAVAGYDYVIIARYTTIDMAYKKLYKELKYALREIKQEINGTPTDTGKPAE